ncbi:hypothetical protein FGG08_005002 [Glutinoglossum americanum]|uniref:Uncharacterized protein n=1 Tax=Glutinoglossum americanum TaxID=1670608 RepID=A0A9P8I3W8_9PEZI|nr:hypothetical protein FGG08_005002 [Glutinoglossum americanum]
MMATQAYLLPPSSALSRVDVVQDRRRATKSKLETASPTSSSSALSPSKPVVIPSRGSPWKSTREVEKTGRRSQYPLRSSPDLHRPETVPPAVAALLAVTAIPLPKHGTSTQHRRHTAEKQVALKLLNGQFQGRDRTPFASPNTKSPMEILLSPPDELDEIDFDTADDSTNEAVLCVRTKSSDSVPSLETDTESSASWSSPPTPRHSVKRANGDRREKQMSSPPAEDCVLNHPLLNPYFDAEASALDSADATNSAPLAGVPDNATRSERRKVSLKSNLTASLRVLKSAARSFSNFSAPFIQPDDFLTRSILSITPLYTDEKRPLPLQDAPTPALRRYLNPISSASADMYSHRGSSKGSLDRCTASIQLQTYRVSRPSKRASSSPIISRRSSQKGDDDPFAQPSSSTGPIPRQREVRENSDFLRVIVLEMNMRREGKLSDKAQGKAKFVLPPRQPCNRYVLEDGVVPLRWTPILPED